MTIWSKQFSLAEEGCDELGPPRPTPDSFEGLAREVTEFPNVSGAEVGKFVLLPIAPQILDRIEFGSVGRQPLDVQPRGVLLKEVLDKPAAMHRRAIPDQQDPAGQLAMQLAEETDDLGALDGTGMQLEIEVAQGQPGDGRETLPIEVESEHRGLTAECPGAGPVGALAQSTFVEEDERPPLPPGFFLMRGHSWLFHAAIFASSRSRARPAGRCGLKPN